MCGGGGGQRWGAAWRPGGVLPCALGARAGTGQAGGWGNGSDWGSGREQGVPACRGLRVGGEGQWRAGGAAGAWPYLQAGDREPPCVVGQGGHGHHEGAVGDVLVVELDGDLVVACRGKVSGLARVRAPCTGAEGGGEALTSLLHHVGDAAGAVLAVLEGDLSLAGPLDGDGQAPGTRLSCPDTELGCGAGPGASAWGQVPPSRPPPLGHLRPPKQPRPLRATASS